MKVGILTFHHITNFGAVLQAYALCRSINELGCDAQVIDYRPEYLVGSYNRLGRRPWCIWNNLKRINKFKRFRKAFLPTSDRIYRETEEMRLHPPEVDVYVCGSDQVWNMIILEEKLDAGFFLDIVPKGKRRVAYAPSFGDTLEFPVNLRNKAAKLLECFDAISIREESGQILLQKLLGRQVPVVLDPSLLVEDYSEVIRKPKRSPERCVVVYPMEYSQPFVQYVQNVRRLLNLPVVNIGGKAFPGADFNYNYLGPSEWLGWIREASFVCTNSFHGTAYSIIFRKNFLVFPLQQRPFLNIRIENLLKGIGLSDRLVVAPDMPGANSFSLRDVNYDLAEPLLRSSVAKSREYLRNAILGGSSRE